MGQQQGTGYNTHQSANLQASSHHPSSPKRSFSKSWSTSSLGGRSSGGQPPGVLPLPANAKTCMSAATKRWRYLRRLLYFRQMDFEFAFWQIVYLISAPHKVYKTAGYRKHTKSQYARDDPAFLVLLSAFLIVSTAGLALVLGLTFIDYFVLVGYVLLVDVVGAGMLVATSLWFLTNRFMLKPAARALEDVEWGFCFDVHLNAFFPVLFILHCVELSLITAFWNPGSTRYFLVTFVADILWLLALTYYVYISFLGYNSL